MGWRVRNEDEINMSFKLFRLMSINYDGVQMTDIKLWRLLGLLAFTASCSRPSKDTSKVSITFPSSTQAKSSALWTALPESSDDINCYAVAVAAPALQANT